MTRNCLLLVCFAVGLTACQGSADPGNLRAFCDLVESTSVLSDIPATDDLAALIEVAPPEIRATIEQLHQRSRGFSDLLLEEPPDLAALFDTKFDPVARDQRTALDVYVETNCGIEVQRPISSRWSTYVVTNHSGDGWVEESSLQFDVDNGVLESVIVVFSNRPEPIELTVEACEAVVAFLRAEDLVNARVKVLVGSIVLIDIDPTNEGCRL